MNEAQDWYISYIKHELEKLQEGSFTGNVGFKVNIKEGAIANMNVELNKSIRMIENPMQYSDRR